jgi:hypothetical protein
MKKILLIFLVLLIANKFVSGQCNGGIALKKDNRDWVKTYNDLEIKYKSKSEKVSSLKHFFYDEKGAKTCISLADLKLLSIKVQEVFKTTKSDKTVTDFKGGISSIAASNPPTSKPNTEVKKPAEGTTVPKKNLESEILNKQTNTQIDSLKSVITQLNNDIENASSDKKILDEKKTSWGILNIILVILSIIGFGLSAWMYWVYYPNKIRKKSESHKSVLESQSEHFKMKEHEWKSRAGEWEREKKALDDKIKDLENKKKDVKTTSGNEKTDNEQKQDKEHQTESRNSESPKPQVSAKQFYLSTPILSPDGKGVFDGSEIYSITSISSLYHFVLVNDKTASFTFLNTPNTVKDALTLPERYLQPACEYTGLNSKATKIITTKDGQAIKEGNTWKVIRKAEIRFE